MTLTLVAHCATRDPIGKSLWLCSSCAGQFPQPMRHITKANWRLLAAPVSITITQVSSMTRLVPEARL